LEHQPEVEQFDVTPKEDGDEDVLLCSGRMENLLEVNERILKGLGPETSFSCWPEGSLSPGTRIGMRFANYLLKPEVAGLTAAEDPSKPGDGVKPDFTVFLHYEHEIRRRRTRW
jgi:hypothetical protein